MIRLFIKYHKPQPCKHLNQHDLIYTANMCYIFSQQLHSHAKLVKQESYFSEVYYIFYAFSKK